MQISLIQNAMKLGQFLSENQEIMIGLSVTVGILGFGLAWVLVPSLLAVAAAGWAAISPFLPFIAIAVAVGSAIGGLAYVWNKNMFGIQDTTKKVFDAIGVAVKWGIDGVKNNINKGIDAINGLIDGVNAIATNAGLPTIGKIPKFRSGVSNFEGGFAKVHEGETLKYLPKGTDVDTRNETMNN